MEKKLLATFALFLMLLNCVLKGTREVSKNKLLIDSLDSFYSIYFHEITIPGECKSTFPLAMSHEAYVKIEKQKISLNISGTQFNLVGEKKNDNSFHLWYPMMCFICCCSFTVEGRFNNDLSFEGTFTFNFSSSPECKIQGKTKGVPRERRREEERHINNYLRYEAPEIPDECKDDSDCVISGCSNEVCSSKVVLTTCDIVPPPPGKYCRCRNGTCRWGN